MPHISKWHVYTVGAFFIGTVAVVLSQIDIKSTLTGRGSTARILVILLLVANLKNFPLAWHYRVWSSYLVHLLFQEDVHFVSTPNERGIFGPAALFQPIITSSRSPLWECDYNLHKSNSTYFSDLDVTRGHLVTAILKDSINKIINNNKTHLIRGTDGKIHKGSYRPMLGATFCSFEREILPYESYEMWSRILCWDRKWLYVVTHFVKKGAVKPDGYTYSSPKNLKPELLGGKKAKRKLEGDTGKIRGMSKTLENKAIFASSISTYVLKLGRLTISPEFVLDNAGLLPPRPGGWEKMGASSKPPASTDIDAAANPAALKLSSGLSEEVPLNFEGEWDWKRVEGENRRGLKFAEHFQILRDLHNEFSGASRPALGVFRDFLW